MRDAMRAENPNHSGDEPYNHFLAVCFPDDELHLLGAGSFPSALLWPGAVLATLSAVYTAFLFAQAKGRDFWQNPLLSVHLLAHALLAGGSVWLLATAALACS